MGLFFSGVDPLRPLIACFLAKRAIDEVEEKAIVRLAITYGVLRRLGFSEDRVEECLKSISGVDLDEASEWVCLPLLHRQYYIYAPLLPKLYLHCTEDELGISSGLILARRAMKTH